MLNNVDLSKPWLKTKKSVYNITLLIAAASNHNVRKDRDTPVEQLPLIMFMVSNGEASWPTNLSKNVDLFRNPSADNYLHTIAKFDEKINNLSFIKKREFTRSTQQTKRLEENNPSSQVNTYWLGIDTVASSQYK